MLWKACYERNEKLAMKHIETGHGLEEVGGEYESTPLLEAVFQEVLLVCKVLVQRGATVTAKNNGGGGILHVAAKNDDSNVLEWALEEGAKNGIGIEDRNNEARGERHGEDQNGGDGILHMAVEKDNANVL